MKKSLFLGAILLITGTVVRADEACPSGTLADYIALGSCTITFPLYYYSNQTGSMTLSGFSYTPGSGAPPASQISVASAVNFVGDPYCIQWPYCMQLDVSFGGFSTTTSLSGSLDFTAGTGSVFTAALLSLGPDGVLADGASIAVQAALSNGLSLSTEILNLPPPAGVDQPFSQVRFKYNQATGVLSVHDSFQANAGPSGSPTTFGFTNSLITPEPSTVFLLGWGLAGLVAAGGKLGAPRP